MHLESSEFRFTIKNIHFFLLLFKYENIWLKTLIWFSVFFFLVVSTEWIFFLCICASKTVRAHAFPGFSEFKLLRCKRKNSSTFKISTTHEIKRKGSYTNVIGKRRQKPKHTGQIYTLHSGLTWTTSIRKATMCEIRQWHYFLCIVFCFVLGGL